MAKLLTQNVLVTISKMTKNKDDAAPEFYNSTFLVELEAVIQELLGPDSIVEVSALDE